MPFYSESSPHSSNYSCHQVYPNTNIPSTLICHSIQNPRHILHTTPATWYTPTYLFYQFYFVLLFIILSTFFILLLPLGISQHNFSICFILSCYSSTSLYSSYQSCHQVYPNESVPSILICHAFHHPRHMLHNSPATRYIPTHLFYQFYFVLLFINLATFFKLLLPLDISQHIFSINFIFLVIHQPRHIIHTSPATRFIPSHLFYQFYFVLLFINLATFCILLLPLDISQHIFSVNFILSCFSPSSPHSSYLSCHQVYPSTSFLSILFCLVIHEPRHILHTTPATRYTPTHLFNLFYYVWFFHHPLRILHTTTATRYIPTQLFYLFYFILLFINLAIFFILLLPLGIPQRICSIYFNLSCFSSSSPHASYQSCHQVYPNTSFLSIFFVLLFIKLATFCIILLALGISQHIFSINFILSCYSSTSPHSSYQSATRFIPSHLFYQFYFVLLFINLATFCILLLPLGLSHHIFSINFILSCYSPFSPHSSYYSCHQIYPNTSFLSILFCLVIHHPLHILHTTPATRYIPTQLFFLFYFVLLFINLATFFILLLPLGLSHHIFSINFILSCYSPSSPHSSYYSCHQIYPNTSFLSILFCLVIHHLLHILHTTPATRYTPTHLFYLFYFVLFFINLSTFFKLLLPLGISQHNFSINFILSCYSSSSPYSSYYSCHQVYPNKSFLSILFYLVIHQPRHILQTTPATRYTPTNLFHLF